MEINEKWHKNNRMPKNATMQQKAEWHASHKKNCGCRPIPESVLEYMRRRQKQSK